MANTNTPTQSTYQQQPVTFYRDTNMRGPESLKDRWFLNMYLESVTTPNTNDKTYYIRNRGGLVPYHPSTLSTGDIRGSLIHNKEVYYVWGTALMKYNRTSIERLWTLPSNNGKPVGLCFFQVTKEGGEDIDIDYIVFGDGDNLWRLNIATGVVTDCPNKYPTPFIPDLQTIDGYLLMVKEGTSDLYSSQVENLDDEYDFISAELYADTIVGLSRYNNYVAALGQFSLELFYNAAIEEGSPFQRNDSTVITVGCSSPKTAVQSERQLIWVGNSQEGELGVWVLEKFDVKEITPPLIRRLLSSPDYDPESYTAFVVRHKGRKYYVLCLGSKENPRESIWVYDLMEKFWYEWEFAKNSNYLLQAGGDLGDGICYILTPKGIYHLTESSYLDDGHQPVFEWQTDNVLFNTMNRKVAHRLTVVGNREPSQVFEVCWSDDDFNTWSPWKTIKMDLERPAIVNMGKFRQRSWKMRNTQNLPIRLENLELYYNLMGN